jgi:TolB protein
VFTRVVDGKADVFLLDDHGKLRNLTHNPADDDTAALSPDGRRVAFSSNRLDRQSDLYVMNVDGSRVRRVTTDRALDWYPTWSPDGKWLAYTAYENPTCTADCAVSSDPGDGDLRIVRADGSEMHTLASTADNKLPDWSPSGTSIVFVRDADLYTVELDGSGFTQLTDTPGGNEYAPEWSPDGTKIVYGFLGSLRVLNLETNAVRDLTTGPEGSDSPSWSPDGSVIVFYKCKQAPADCATHRLWTVDVATGNQAPLLSTSTSDYFPDWGVIAR